MFSIFRRMRQRRVLERIRLEAIANELRLEGIARAKDDISRYPDDEWLSGATLYTMRNVPLLTNPYYETMVINKPIGGGRTRTGWERHSAAGKKDGFVRAYDLHGKTVAYLKQVLDDPEVQRSFVEFEYHAPSAAIAAYAQMLLD